MMLLLIVDIAYDLLDFIPSQRDNTVALLPPQLEFGMNIPVNPERSSPLQPADKLAYKTVGGNLTNKGHDPARIVTERESTSSFNLVVKISSNWGRQPRSISGFARE